MENRLEKEIAIAKMAGWKYWPKTPFWKLFVRYDDAWEAPSKKFAVSTKGLQYLTNMGWQFEILNLIKNAGYTWHVMFNVVLIMKGEKRQVKTLVKVEYKNGEYPNEAIFEALYQFSLLNIKI